ncbi:Ger(x)C family spore germination protein [Cohnella lupini]|uniref:Spore germination protein KC n=1 Tax=Cohnella lupini TaxID=1294267 RepID=A0A3D9IEV6_9BACL|nr:Ger(x)C family spore germination protein [Cohnella lupini]RED60230.1 spore germination protein KC [Cohnella lupini]
MTLYRRLLNLTALLALLTFLLSGCWSRKELNELSVVIGLGVDKLEDGYEVSLQVVDPSQMSRNRSAERSAVIVISEKAPTLFEALRKATTKSPRKLYLSHIHMLLFDEEAARTGINEPLDFLLRDHQVRPDFYIAVAKDFKAKEVLGFVTPFEVLPALELYKSLEVSEKLWAPTSAIKVTQLMKIFTEQGVQAVLTGITLTGDAEKGNTMDNVKQPTSLAEYRYIGIGVFKQDRLLGWLNESDSKAWSYVTNNVKTTVGTSECPRSDGRFAVDITHSSSKMIPYLLNGQPAIRLKTVMDANIGEMHCKLDLEDESNLLQLQNTLNRTLAELISTGIRNVQQQYGVDVFGFGEEFHRKYPKLWKTWRNDWDDRFKTMPVQVDSEFKLNKMGESISPMDYKQAPKE